MTPLAKTFDLDFLVDLDTEEELYNEISHQFNELSRDFYSTANLELIRRLNLRPNERVLDLACGTGYIAIELARRVPEGKVVGVDLSPLMIRRAREDAVKAGLKNVEFIEKNIHDVLPDFKAGAFDVGVSCFALSYLGCDFLFKEFRRILGEKGRVGITTSSVNSLTEWMPLFLEFLVEHGEKAASFQINEIPDMPLSAEDLKARMESAGFSNIQVLPQKIPLAFRDSQEAASFLISAGWISNYFFRVKDKKARREILDWCVDRVDRHHQNDPQIATSIEFLVAWNEP